MTPTAHPACSARGLALSEFAGRESSQSPAGRAFLNCTWIPSWHGSFCFSALRPDLRCAYWPCGRWCDALLSRLESSKPAPVSLAKLAYPRWQAHARPRKAGCKAPSAASAEFDPPSACLETSSNRDSPIRISRSSLVVGRSGLHHSFEVCERPTTIDQRLPTKNRRDRSTLMVPEMGTEPQSRRFAYRLRKCTCQEYRSILRPCAPRTHQEHNILPALQRRLDLRKVVRIVDGLLVHFQNHVAAIQTEILGERSLFYVLHHHALARRNAEAIGQIGSD